MSNEVQGCYVGLAPNGTTPAPNDYEGINIGAGAHANVIGGTNASQRNVISGNSGYAITITSTNSNGNVVKGNYIGLNGSGTASVANTYNGIGIWGGSSSNVIGGSGAGAGNVISGNIEYGIFISDTNTTATVVQGNFIGINAAGTGIVSNTWSGLAIVGGSYSNLIANNVVSGNASYGIFISDQGTSSNVIQGNFIGTSLQGTTALPNAYMGIGIWSDATDNLIGGTTAAARNIISGNGNNGIGTGFANSGGNVIEGNYIGVTSNGLSAVLNNGVGVYVETSQQSNIIESNVISGNTSDGIYLYQSTNNVVQGNDIGVAANGTTALANGGDGVYLYLSESNLIGGSAAGQRNVISGNLGNGIDFFQVTNNVVQGNYIGTVVSGLLAMPNAEDGLTLVAASQSNQITGNIIAASGNYGVVLSDPGTDANVLQGNNIGVGADGATALGNTWQGMVIQSGASSNTIGQSLAGSGAGNIIADNGYGGVILYSTNTLGNSIRANSIFGNSGPGIDLVPVSPGQGPNDLENYPVLTSVAVFTNTMVVAGTVSNGANRIILVDIYYNPAQDPTGYGQGRTFAGTATAQTGASGTGSFSLPFATRLAGQYFSATATDASTGNTSQFSLDVEATNVAGAGPGEFTSLHYSSTNGFSFDITLATNQNYSIQETTNLSVNPIVWTDVTDFFATTPSVQILDRAATNSRQRFYRAITP